MRRPQRIIATASTPPPQGFPRWAWWTVLLSILLFVVPATSPWWSTILRAEIPESPEDEPAGPPGTFGGGPGGESAIVPESTIKVVLYMPNPIGPGLVTVDREIRYARGVVPQIRSVLSELGIASPEVAALLPAGAVVLDVAFTPAGTAYVDFSPEFEQGRDVGAEEERVLVQGIVTTLIDNFTAVRRVVIVVDGKAPRPGHLDLSRPFRRDDPAFAPDEAPDPDLSVGDGAPDPSPSRTLPAL